MFCHPDNQLYVSTSYSQLTSVMITITCAVIIVAMSLHMLCFCVATEVVCYVCYQYLANYLIRLIIMITLATCDVISTSCCLEIIHMLLHIIMLNISTMITSILILVSISISVLILVCLQFQKSAKSMRLTEIILVSVFVLISCSTDIAIYW